MSQAKPWEGGKVTRIRQLYISSVSCEGNEGDKNIESKGKEKDVEIAKDIWEDN